MSKRLPTRRELKAAKRYVIEEVDVGTGADGPIVGKRNGYETVAEAVKIVEAAAAKHPEKTYVLSLYTILDGARNHEETIEYYGKGNC